MCPLLLDPCSFKDNNINNIVCWKSPSQWTYIRQNQMYTVHNIIRKWRYTQPLTINTTGTTTTATRMLLCGFYIHT